MRGVWILSAAVIGLVAGLLVLIYLLGLQAIAGVA